MSVSLNITAYSSKDSPEFQKHYKAVQFCIENKLSFPKETSEFFKGKVGGDDLEDIYEDHILEYIEHGVEVPLDVGYGQWGHATIKVADIPKEADTIIITMQ